MAAPHAFRIGQKVKYRTVAGGAQAVGKVVEIRDGKKGAHYVVQDYTNPTKQYSLRAARLEAA